MKLSRVERWILSNQYKILERLDPETGDYYRRSREAIDSGYEREYEHIAEYVLPEHHCLSEDDCREVLDILTMFRDLKRAHDALENGGGIVSTRPDPGSEMGQAIREPGPRH